MLTRTSITLVLLTLLSLVLGVTAGPLASSKRGLCFVPNSTYPNDNYIWRREPSDLTWYYNYGASPSPVYANWTQSQFEFVPMLWGAPSDTSDTTFLSTVKGLINNSKVNISHVLSFNEPDAPSSWGGSDVSPSNAAKVWVSNIIPLQEMGVKVGLPAVTGATTGLTWLKQFVGNCSQLVSSGSTTKNCTYDFLPIHWYGNFGGLASHLGEAVVNFPNTSIWVTEYNLDHSDLGFTQDFYNMSAEYFDRLSYVERYSIFAAFRSDVSSVGANASLLNNAGQLTDIGAWYLGRQQTGVSPTSGSSAVRGAMPALGLSLAVAYITAAMLVGL